MSGKRILTVIALDILVFHRQVLQIAPEYERDRFQKFTLTILICFSTVLAVPLRQSIRSL